jgi:hypothetical protein
MSPSNDSDAPAKDVMRQEQFWFTATTLGFTGFVGALLRTPSLWDTIISLVLIYGLTIFTVYLIVGRHKAYCALNKTQFSSWHEAFKHTISERSGALYCVVVVSFAAVGFTLILIMRYFAPLGLSQSVGSQTTPAFSSSVIVPATISNSTTSNPAHKP